MFKIITFITIYLLTIEFSLTLKTVDNYLSERDLLRLHKVFEDGIKQQNELQSVHYSVLNYVDKMSATDKANLCKRLNQLYVESKFNDYEKNYYFIGTHKSLQCVEKIPAEIIKSVTTSFEKEMSLMPEIYFNLLSVRLLGSPKIDKSTVDRLVKNCKNILKKDDSLMSLGYAFHTAVELGEPSFVYDRVEDAMVQADEVDGKMLQFEGGLSITSLIINGTFSVINKFKKALQTGDDLPIKEDNVKKLSTYFLSRRSVQTPKGAHILIDTLQTISSNKELAPICIQVIGNGQLNTESPLLNIKVVDLLGKPLKSPISSISGKVLAKKGNAVLAEKVTFTSKSSDKTVYNVDLSSYKPVRGSYIIEIKADSYEHILNFKVLGRVKVHSLEIGIGDSDAASAIRKQSIVYPSTLSQPMNADHTQKLVLKLLLTDEGTNKMITVHQAFVRLANKNTDEEIIFVAEQDTSKAYKFDMDVGARSADFGHKSGLYKVELIIGDSSISNSFKWHIADVQLKFAHEPKKDKLQINKNRSPLPEIQHKFREPEKRPSRIVSDIFTGLCLTPLVLLLILWIKLGVNIKNFTFSLSTIGFHLGFGAILALFAVFWLKLNMFETTRYLIPIAIFTFLCGNKLLRSIAARKSSS